MTRVHRDEACLEWLYYLVLLLCVPFTVDQDDYCFNTDKFTKGDLVARISYYEFIDCTEGGFRKYRFLDGKKKERMVHI